MEVRDVMRMLVLLARSVIRASVIPSAKYSCSGSLERFSRGITARAEICGVARHRASTRLRNPPRLMAIATARQAITDPAAIIHGRGRNRRGVLSGGLSGAVGSSLLTGAMKR